MNKNDVDREKKLRVIIDMVKLQDAPLGDEFEQAYTDPLTTDYEKDKFISVVRRSIIHGVKLSDEEMLELATLTAELLTTRKILNKFKK